MRVVLERNKYWQLSIPYSLAEIEKSSALGVAADNAAVARDEFWLYEY